MQVSKNLKEDIYLEDTTLRDGEQGPGIAFPKEVKIAIHDLLVAAGVRWIEAGIPTMGGEELDTLKTLLARGSDATLVAWSRGLRSDVAFTLDIGFKAIHIALPTSTIHLESRLNQDRKWLLDRAKEVVNYAKERGAYVSISAEDVGRTEIPFLQDYACTVLEAGADRLRLSDTIGILTPEQYAQRVRAVKEVCDIELQCHTHNDFGLAVANALAGLEAGARSFHVTVNGIGERAGMADLAQVVMTLKCLYGVELGIDSKQLSSLSNFVAEAVHQRVVPWQPIVGAHVFAHESGIHAKAMLSNTATFEPFPPEWVGGCRHYVIGKHSGRAVLQFVLKENGIDVAIEELGPCMDAVKDAATRQGRSLTSEQVKEIFYQVQRSQDFALSEK